LGGLFDALKILAGWKKGGFLSFLAVFEDNRLGGRAFCPFAAGFLSFKK
jgi:hypothetical protein